MFGGVNPAKLVEVDKPPASTSSTPLGNLELTNAFAFSFFAGDFYMFTESNNPNFSKVTHLDYARGGAGRRSAAPGPRRRSATAARARRPARRSRRRSTRAGRGRTRACFVRRSAR
jgi:hypothetical protein